MSHERDRADESGRAARATGARGEDFAALFLEGRGYRIVARNFRAGRRELDLVVERGELLVAVEVKWRRVTGGRAEGHATAAWRQAQRSRAGEAVLAAMEMVPRGRERPWRFDVIAIEEGASGLVLAHHRGAWSPGGSYW